METFATPANFLSETAARSSSRGFFTLEKRERRSLERATTLGPTQLRELRGEKETRPLEKGGGERGRERGGGLKTEQHGDRGGEWSNSTVISFFG